MLTPTEKSPDCVDVVKAIPSGETGSEDASKLEAIASLYNWFLYSPDVRVPQSTFFRSCLFGKIPKPQQTAIK